MHIHHVTPGELCMYRDALMDLYQRCFTQPPWNESPDQVDAYGPALSGHLVQPGVSGVVVAEGDELVGAIYGWPAPASLPDDPFHRALVPAVPKACLPLLVAPAVIVTELMVHPGHQRRGIGRTLLDRFVAGHPSAWLCTHPDAPACALYESANWCAIARYTNQYGDARVLYTWRSPHPRAHTWQGTTLRFPRRQNEAVSQLSTHDSQV